MENIFVSDNFCNSDELNKINEIIKKNNWKWGHASKHESRIETTFWSMDLINFDYFTIYLKEVIEKHFNKKFIINRVYANGQTFGQDAAFHTDSDDENDYTFVLYMSKINDEYVEAAGGNIYFNIPNLTYKICYEPIYNRGIFFPSNYLHKACSFTRYIQDLRICIAWKLTEIKPL